MTVGTIPRIRANSTEASDRDEKSRVEPSHRPKTTHAHEHAPSALGTRRTVRPRRDATPDGRQPRQGAPMTLQYDSARITVRTDRGHCDYGEQRAKTYSQTVDFFSGSREKIVDGST